MVERVRLIRAKHVFSHVDVYLPYLFIQSFVCIECGFVRGLINLLRVYHLVAKEGNGVQVVAKSECANADRVYLVGYSYILQLCTIVESIIANDGD